MPRSAVSALSKSLLAVSLLLAPAGAGARVQDAAAIQEDAAMSCEALAAEIDAQPAPKKKKKKGLGFLRVLGAVSPLGGMVGGVGGMGGMVASSALSVAARDGGRPENTAPDPSELRRHRLAAISAEKGC